MNGPSLSVAAGAIAVVLTACGGSSSSPTTQPTPTPRPAPTPELVSQGGAAVCGACGYWFYFTLRTAGTVTITVDYTYPDSTVWLWLATGHCTYEMSEAGQCSWTANSRSTEKPRKLTLSLVAGEYTLVLDNRTDRNEAMSFQVAFTASASAASRQTAMPPHSVTPTTFGPLGPSAPRASVP